MLQKQSIQKRKARRLYKYFYLSAAIFCGVLGICIVSFLFLRHSSTLKSPLATLTMSSSHAVNDTNQVQFFCSKYNLSCGSIQESGDTVTFVVNNATIYVSTAKDMDEQIHSLQLTIRALTMEGKEFHRLDFRYDRPVIAN